MNITDAVQTLYDFLREAGEFARSKQKGIRVTYKDGNQALTETDLAVSRLAQERLLSFLSQPDHVLIDEESITRTPSDVFSQSTYQWILDPIDGTAGYALGRGQWGISLGVMKQGVPLIGGIYMPVAGYFLLSDGYHTYSIDAAHGTRTRVECIKMPVHSQIFVETFLNAGTRPRKTYDDIRVWANTPESAVQGAVTTLLGQSAGAVFTSDYSIWDAAGAMALGRTAGFTLVKINTQKTWDAVKADDFHDNWKLRDHTLMCHADNVDVLLKALFTE